MVTWAAIEAIATVFGVGAAIYIGWRLYQKERLDKDKVSLYQLKVLLANRIIVPWQKQYQLLKEYHERKDDCKTTSYVIFCLIEMEETVFKSLQDLDEKLFLAFSKIKKANEDQYFAINILIRSLEKYRNQLYAHYDLLCGSCGGNKNCPNTKKNSNQATHFCDIRLDDNLNNNLMSTLDTLNRELKEIMKILGEDEMKRLVEKLK